MKSVFPPESQSIHEVEAKVEASAQPPEVIEVDPTSTQVGQGRQMEDVILASNKYAM